jgi:hypothetical protein
VLPVAHGMYQVAAGLFLHSSSCFWQNQHPPWRPPQSYILHGQQKLGACLCAAQQCRWDGLSNKCQYTVLHVLTLRTAYWPPICQSLMEVLSKYLGIVASSADTSGAQPGACAVLLPHNAAAAHERAAAGVLQRCCAAR